MKAAVVERRGAPGGLRLGEVPVPAARAREVLLRVEAASINDWDFGLLQRGSLLDRTVGRLAAPRVRILGCDVAGRVEAVGPGVTAFRPGDEAYGDLCARGFGAFAEYACAPESALAPKPPGMSFEQAAAIPQAAMLAVQGLDAGGLRAGQQVLLNGAGGGVGTFALQLARWRGAEVTAVDRGAKLDLLRALGASRVVDYAAEDFTLQGRRYDLVLDVKTNRRPRDYVRALAPSGVYATVGGELPRLLQVLLAGAALPLASRKRLRVVALKPNRDLAHVNELFAAGRLRPVIDSIYPLAEVHAALQRFGSGDHQGKIVLRVR